MPNVIYSTIGISGATYETPQAWETGTRKDLVTADEVHIGVIGDTGQWTWPNSSLFIGAGTTDSTHYRQLTTDNTARYSHVTDRGVYIGATTGGISGGENYFRLGPGIGCFSALVQPSVSLTGIGIYIDGISVFTSGYKGGIKIWNDGGTGAVINSLVYGNVSGIAISVEQNNLCINNTIYTSHNYAIGISGGYSLNNAVFIGGIIGNTISGRCLSGVIDNYCATSDRSATGDNSLTGLLAIHQFLNTTSGSEDFRTKSAIYSNIYQAAFTVRSNFGDEGFEYEGVLGALTGSTLLSQIRSSLSQDNLGSQRDTNANGLWDIGAFSLPTPPAEDTNIFNQNRVAWRLSEYNPDNFTGFVGGNVSTNTLYSGPVDTLPLIVNPISLWKSLSGSFTNLPRIKIASNSITGSAYFYRSDTNEEIIFRGWNFFNRSGNGIETWYSDFGNFNSGTMNTLIADIASDGYNCVRTFIDIGSATGGRTNAVVSGLTYTDLSYDYLNNYATFVNICKNNKVYILNTLYGIPNSNYYTGTLWTPAYYPTNIETGNYLLDPGYYNSKKAYVTGFMANLSGRIGTGAMSTIWAWMVDDRASYDLTQAPYSTGKIDSSYILSGALVTGSGTWNMGVLSERNESARQNATGFYGGLVTAMQTIDPDCLVCISTNPRSNTGNLYDVTPFSGTSTITDINKHYLSFKQLTGSNLDFICFNMYLDSLNYATGNLISPITLLNRNEYSGAPLSTQPVVISEVGISRTAHPSLTGSLITNQIRQFIDLDGLDTKGLLLYNYYGDTSGFSSYYGYTGYSGFGEMFSPNTSPNIPGIDANTVYVYRKIFGYSLDQVINNPRVYLDNTEYIDQISIAAAKASNDIAYSSYKIPVGYSDFEFVSPYTYQDGIEYNVLSSGDSAGIWTRIKIDGPISDPQAGFTIILEGTDKA